MRQQRNGTAVVEIGVNSFDGLIVVDPDGPDLGVKIRQAQVVVVRVLVSLNDFERSAEDTGKNKMRFVPLSHFQHHLFKLRLLLFIQPKCVNVILRVGDPFLFFHILNLKG